MSIATEISRIQTAKADLKTAIEAKGVTVPSSATIDTYDDYVSQISGGGGDDSALIGLIERTATTINIPSGTTKIGYAAFMRYTNLTDVIMPDSITNIDYYAFSECENLANINISNNTEAIGVCAFQYCKSLQNIVIPDSVIYINESAFAYCSGLTNVTIGSGVTSVGYYAFQKCTKLTSLTFPSSIREIRDYALRDCSGLTSITVNATTPPRAYSTSFDGTSSNLVIYVPSESVETYKAASGWSTYASRIQAIP